MVEHHVSRDLIDKIYHLAPVGVSMKEFIADMLKPYNAQQKNGMNFTFVFDNEKDYTAFLLKWG